MGTGYVFRCKKCNYEYNISPGIRILKYRQYIEDIKEGKYGEELREIALSQPYVAIDVSEKVYQCEFCGCWKVDISLSLYRPIDPNSMPKTQSRRKTAKEPSCIPCVMPYELKEEYMLIKKYQHRCEKCRSFMHEVEPDALQMMPCPRCQTENEYYAIETNR